MRNNEGGARRMQSGFWKADWFLAVAVVVLFALFNAASDLVPSLENKAYDLGMQAANSGLSRLGNCIRNSARPRQTRSASSGLWSAK